MKLKNILLVVSDLSVSKQFYNDLFGLQVLMEQEGNVIMTEGLDLQDAKIWNDYVCEQHVLPHYSSLIYFEEYNMENFIEKLQNYQNEIRYVSSPLRIDGKIELVRIMDPDGHVIEVKKVKNRTYGCVWRCGVIK